MVKISSARWIVILKKIKSIPTGEKRQVCGMFFLISICLPKKKMDEQFSYQCLFKQIFEKGQQDREEKGTSLYNCKR